MSELSCWIIIGEACSTRLVSLAGTDCACCDEVSVCGELFEPCTVGFWGCCGVSGGCDVGFGAGVVGFCGCSGSLC